MTENNRARKIVAEVRKEQERNRTLRIAWQTIPLVMRKRLEDDLTRTVEQQIRDHIAEKVPAW